MWYLIAAFALSTTTTAGVTATRLDGTTVVGQLESWNDDQLVLATTDATQAIPIADLQSVRLGPRVQSDGPLAPVLIAVDGSSIPIREFGAVKGTASTTVDDLADAAAPRAIDLPLRSIRAVRLLPLNREVADQWEEIVGMSLPHDLIVVIKRGGKSLDYLEGIVGDVAPESIEFTLDDAKIDVPRAKVAGIVFYHPTAATAPPPCVITGRNDLRLAAEGVHLEGEILHAKTVAGIQLTWPLEHVQHADYSAGKIVFLSDLTAVSQTWQPLVSLPATTTDSAHFGQPRFDQSVAGGPLSLWHPNSPSPDGSGSVRSFDKGLAIRSRTELVYRLPRGFARFAAVAGIEPSTRVSGNVMLTVYGDEQPLMEAAISGHDAPLPIELDVTNVKRLSIVVDYGDNLDTGDWLNLCNARLVK